jgi:hypothetical protein
VLTKRGKKLWHTRTVKYLLQNQVCTGIRYYNRQTRAAEPAKGREHAPVTYRDRAVRVGVPVPAIISQEMFDRVQARMQTLGKRYRHPVTTICSAGW